MEQSFQRVKQNNNNKKTMEKKLLEKFLVTLAEGAFQSMAQNPETIS